MQRRKQTFKPHIVHNRHSFKLLPTHHTSYSLLGFMLLLVGIFSVGWTSYVEGQTTDGGSYSVRAIVPAEPLTLPATIESPADQTRFTDQLITVNGDCPVDSYVHLLRNNVFAGAALCSNGHWSLNVSLVAGKNTLQAQAYNITDQAGPVSASRTVFYDPPVTAPAYETLPQTSITQSSSDATPSKAPSAKTKPAATVIKPLVLSGGFSYLGVQVGDELTQKFTLVGGTAPYAITINWGDGTTDTLSRAEAGEFSASHVYKGPGVAVRSSYSISVNVSDVKGQKASLQTMAIVTMPSSAGTSGTTSSGDGIIGQLFGGNDNEQSLFSTWRRVILPVYGVSAVALASFWFGQHRELELLRQRAMHRPQRLHHHR